MPELVKNQKFLSQGFLELRKIHPTPSYITSTVGYLMLRNLSYEMSLNINLNIKLTT